MSVHDTVQVFESSSTAYHHAFQTFLDHTDQKQKAREWLDKQIARLPRKRLLIDAGAGNGKVTAWFTDLFQKTIALEPNPSLRAELSEVCPAAFVLPDSILSARIAERADFVLSSHVFYYIPAEEWMANLERLVSWIAPGGTLTVIIQNSQSDCMRLLRHFLKRAFDLKELETAFRRAVPQEIEVTLETVPSHITAPDLKTAYLVTEFMLNLLPLKTPPSAQEVRAYVEAHFQAPGGGFRFSCSQDFLTIRRC